MRIIKSFGKYHLADIGGGKLWCCWFHHSPEIVGKDARPDGLIYIAGFMSQKSAEIWAREKGIMPPEKWDDPQGDL